MKKLFAIILSIMILCAMPVCSAEEMPVLRVGVLASYYSAAIYYADAMGYDTEAGIDMRLVEFENGLPMNYSFADGELELADMGPAAVSAVGQFGAKVIAQNAKQVAVNLMVRADSPLLAARDENGVYGSADIIKGMTFMGPSGTFAHYLIIGYLNYFGLKFDDINYVDAQYPDALAAFTNGEGDVCCMQNPNVYDATVNGCVALGSPSVIAPMYENIICSDKAYDESFDALVKALTVIYRAQEDFIADDALAAKWLGEYYAKVGYVTSEEAVMDEVQNQRPLLSMAEAAKVPVGESLINTAEFLRALDVIDDYQADMVRDNVVTDVLKAACDIRGIECAQ